jgi:cholesterol transport system auxiliary component
MMARTLLALGLGLGLLSGCSAISAVSGATEPLDAYTLSPVRPAAVRSQGQHVVVVPAAASGALATDRILVKPNRLQAEYLPRGRWVDPAPVLVQALLVASLQNSGAFRLVGRDDAGLIPDFSVLSDLQDFQAEAPVAEGQGWTVRVGLTVTLVDEIDRRLVASRRFEEVATAPSDQTLTLVNAFDAAMGQAQHKVVAWVIAETR